MANEILKATIVPDEFTAKVSKAFDFEFDGVSTFELPPFHAPSDFIIGAIVGSSGSGKTQILRKHYGYTDPVIEWNRDKAIISHFKTPEEAVDKMFAVGLSSIPTLCRPFHVLSNGEQFRATMARQLKDGMCIDEFTSVVNRETAKSLSVSMAKYIRKNGLSNVVIASCHKDILEWLEPDWVYDTDINYLEGGLFPTISSEIDFTKRSKVAKIEIY